MKKALALVLALVLALSMAVSAFALTLELELVPEKVNGPIKFVDSFDFNKYYNDEEGNVILTQNYKGGVFYSILVHGTEVVDLSDVKIVTSGNVTAELVEYNPETMVDYLGENEAAKFVTYSVKEYDGTKVLKSVTDSTLWGSYTGAADLEGESYKWAVAAAEWMNRTYDTTVYRVVADNEVYVVKFTVADNFSASYTEGSVKITAVCDNCRKAVAMGFTVINDTAIFGYEAVKNAALYNAKGDVLTVKDAGYSDYLTAFYGYKNPEINVIDRYDHAEVISTTAFRAIEGKNITVEAGNAMTVTIKNVAKGQKGLNFLSYGDNALTREIEFGFKNNTQKVASDFEVVLDLNMTYFQLREYFREKIEEDDVVDFYLTKDGKEIDRFEVDFMTEDYNEKFVLVVECKAGETLGQYTLDIAAPVVAEGEENPNTGAESVVGVVAALAVVSVATAAAVSLKK